ncbi:hypothetical protein I6H88_13925 [Elizabethkingia bruuniana]|uniref:Uncharacterized protein n=2 Tax=Elizabethkingia TaxID=308865 RepID=A0A7T8A0C7_9FLAO|nr:MULTISPECIES: hypothetical protein [Elizabethkingia]MDC8028309.1 hypothetical protein [Elizabethkingia anophelis]MDQ8748405.1 hypothetical protein [Elizabethkingia miricola]MDV3490926.1 hypothetical protein [Elizabethkingia anophelis]QDZ63226.1 hypothetical protein EVD20_12085 [Elizabethkingia bruuniana]QQN61134.1 hypothetical protein I6H88_13925 [Elizabethkingia bruuniana]
MYGNAGQICHHFSWSLEYLLWEVDWRIVQRMLIDGPDYDYDKDDDKKTNTNTKSIKLTEQSPDELIEKLKQYQ